MYYIMNFVEPPSEEPLAPTHTGNAQQWLWCKYYITFLVTCLHTRDLHLWYKKTTSNKHRQEANFEQMMILEGKTDSNYKQKGAAFVSYFYWLYCRLCSITNHSASRLSSANLLVNYIKVPEKWWEKNPGKELQNISNLIKLSMIVYYE